ncbi:uncharacterized protein BDR25DRAFT_356270 [Lindgomyces ingoldianus]|uniref:Uncharacterized protein n=1 Tax=Lindgomyces ingoldianus TaxID=673940 RepID=A0ACB6QRA2_9PLEO|nr:uncharacterized protein BDR25DRAFT_356270 [Lindgomyces ingoldianus]KAF2469549.1 hypothetical protein BDR25DRAFT_356270 [Lindgomyces ingoldianus]
MFQADQKNKAEQHKQSRQKKINQLIQSIIIPYIISKPIIHLRKPRNSLGAAVVAGTAVTAGNLCLICLSPAGGLRPVTWLAKVPLMPGCMDKTPKVHHRRLGIAPARRTPMPPA